MKKYLKDGDELILHACQDKQLDIEGQDVSYVIQSPRLYCLTNEAYDLLPKQVVHELGLWGCIKLWWQLRKEIRWTCEIMGEDA